MNKRREVETWLTPSVEDFLKAVYHLQQANEMAAISRLADELGIAPSSATDMVKRLACASNDGGEFQEFPVLLSNTNLITACG